MIDDMQHADTNNRNNRLIPSATATHPSHHRATTASKKHPAMASASSSLPPQRRYQGKTVLVTGTWLNRKLNEWMSTARLIHHIYYLRLIVVRMSLPPLLAGVSLLWLTRVITSATRRRRGHRGGHLPPLLPGRGQGETRGTLRYIHTVKQSAC